ncbi:MAG: sigma-54 dependent transcriptional regulator [Tannerella sp.]|jgi:DNA-binding NtrC family response regulator|nr:sigma-54 dependent transcriptional regulator [Tannerella sp.]
MNKKGKLLIVDDNEDVLFALNTLLSSYVEKVKVTANPESIERYMREFQPDVILLDMNFRKDMVSGEEGFLWLKRILKYDPESVVVLMTAYADTDKTVKAIKAGATDFIPKPWEKEKLLATLNAAIKLRESQKETSVLKSQLQALNVGLSDEIIGESAAMSEILNMVRRISNTDANVLILGENGTGKDLIARFIHQNSLRQQDIFVSIDLGAISESLFESELFGYEKGAFTDAKKEKPGRLEIASGGTLFLDEIANLSLSMQAKILTTIEKKHISRLGSTKNIPIDVRFISATNANIYRAIENGLFRQDLLYRINTIEIHIPPLRERENDIILLAEYFIRKFRNKYRKDVHGILQDAKRKLMTYTWPGNVRELQNAVERAVILSFGKYLKADDFIFTAHENRQFKNSENLNLKQLEQDAIEKALLVSDGNMNKAAEMLGITRYALYRKMKRNE